MIRTLFIIAGSAFLLCLVSFAGAAALGGADIQRNGWSWTIQDDGDRIDVRRRDRNEPDVPQTTRTIAWSGGETLTMEALADVIYTQGDAATVVITGPQGVVDRYRVENGRVFMTDGEERVTFDVGPNGMSAWADTERVEIRITAPDVRRFDLRSSQDLTIRDYDQDTMSVDVSGSGDVQATGRVRALAVDLSGSGEIDLADLTTTDATIDISGSGEARVAPTGEANVSISGSGDVDLTTRPARLIQDISGSGDVDVRG